MSFKVKDHYFKKAKKENFFARSVYKLEEIDKKYKILSPGNHVLDLGYHPGSWIQYASKAVSENGKVIGIDIKPVNESLRLSNVTIYEKDAFSLLNVSDLGVNKKFDVVLSDMAPNTTGIKDVDQIRSLELVEKVFNTLPVLLRPGGNVVVKVFDSNDAQHFLKNISKSFESFKKLKPKSTRSVSKEFFAIGLGYK
ncbi:MAG: 50S rRNA methyltransferase [Halobacteriovoraceae bacterium]|nr:50S rRNA methyltransferase [Halobacteriovoraceae bacterium]